MNAMNTISRRQFLSRGVVGAVGIGAGALVLSSGSVLADVTTYQQFHAALKKDPSLAVYADTVGSLAGNAKIQGRLPRDLNGVFFRNGPGRFELGGERYHHWFDGDGFAQRWQIGNGKVSHSGKFVNTQKFVAEQKAGQFLYPTFGTNIARAPIKNNDTVNTANTNLLPLAGRLYALWEGGSATEIDPVTLETLGIKTWREDLKSMPFSAHPKVAADGSLWNFGAMPGSDKLALYQLKRDGSLANFGVVVVPNLAMVHDFAVSAAHLIFLIPPFDVQPAPERSFLEMHHWAGSGPKARPMRVVVVAKADLQIRQIFELPAYMCFHLGNAFDDGNTTRFDAVMHEGDPLNELGGLMRGEVQRNDTQSSSTLQITLDYASKRASETRLFGVSEFPRVMPQMVGVRHRRLVLLGLSPGSSDAALNTVNLLNTDSGKTDSYTFDAGWHVEEHVLVPRRHARSETDGYLLGVAQHTAGRHTVLTVFDAARISAGPMALAHLPYRAPICFHGNFLSV
jgi:all-trans-8'-apo-beta-carotenal 15,15'-oxygenase